MSELEREIAVALNRASVENESDTPDFILAQFLIGCLDAYNRALVARHEWHQGPPAAVDRLTATEGATT